MSIQGNFPRLALLAAWLAAPVTGYGSDWVQMPFSSIEASVYFMDAGSLVRRGSFVRVWERLVFNTPRTNPALGAFQSAQFYLSYDCRRQSAALLETRLYRDAASQDLITTHIRPRPRYLYAAPDTPAAMKLEEVCNRAKRR